MTLRLEVHPPLPNPPPPTTTTTTTITSLSRIENLHSSLNSAERRIGSPPFPPEDRCLAWLAVARHMAIKALHCSAPTRDARDDRDIACGEGLTADSEEGKGLLCHGFANIKPPPPLPKGKKLNPGIPRIQLTGSQALMQATLSFFLEVGG